MDKDLRLVFFLTIMPSYRSALERCLLNEIIVTFEYLPEEYKRLNLVEYQRRLLSETDSTRELSASRFFTKIDRLVMMGLDFDAATTIDKVVEICRRRNYGAV